MIKIQRPSLVLSMFILLCSGVQAQTGVLNKKNMFSIDGLGNVPLLAGNFKEDIYTTKGSELTSGKDRLNYGFSLGYVRQLNRRVGMGLEYVMKQTKLQAPEYFLTLNTVPGSDLKFDSTKLRMEQIQVLTSSYLFRKEGNRAYWSGSLPFFWVFSIEYSK